SRSTGRTSTSTTGSRRGSSPRTGRGCCRPSGWGGSRWEVGPRDRTNDDVGTPGARGRGRRGHGLVGGARADGGAAAVVVVVGRVARGLGSGARRRARPAGGRARVGGARLAARAPAARA